MSAELTKLIEESKARVAAMSPDERADMCRKQAESWVRSIVDWPKPQYGWVNGVKVYASYADYCND